MCLSSQLKQNPGLLPRNVLFTSGLYVIFTEASLCSVKGGFIVETEIRGVTCFKSNHCVGGGGFQTKDKRKDQLIGRH